MILFLIRRLLELLATRASSADARHQLILSKKGLEPDNFKTIPLKLYFPPPALCTDNGVMVAWAGIEKIKLGISDSIDGQVRHWEVVKIFIKSTESKLEYCYHSTLTHYPTKSIYHLCLLRLQEVIARWPLGSPIQDGQATFRKGGLKN